ncbi:hypothetical protein D3C86_1697650 [compost metagenome]
MFYLINVVVILFIERYGLQVHIVYPQYFFTHFQVYKNTSVAPALLKFDIPFVFDGVFGKNGQSGSLVIILGRGDKIVMGIF